MNCFDISRSWQANGRAARLAVSLGLNLRVDSSQMDPMSKETRGRIWWSIVALEHALLSMTGRPSCIDYQVISVQPPLPYDDAQFKLPEVAELLRDASSRERKLQLTIHASNSEVDARKQWLMTIDPNQSLYFFHLIDLSVIMHTAIKAIYSPTATKGSIQSKILFYREKLQSWISSLQPAFTVSIYKANNVRGSSAPNCREQITLAMSYYSSEIILSRPCLKDTGVETGTNTRIPRSHFENNTAKACVHFALTLISVLPNEPDMKWVLNMTSCWSLLHYIMQALTILLIQLSNCLVPVTTYGKHQTGGANEGEGAEAVREAAKKALLWLHSMGKQESNSHRAFHISQQLFHLISPSKAWLDLRGVSSNEISVAGQEKEKAVDTSEGLNGLGPMSLNIPDSIVNWGPDCTASESMDEAQEVPLSLNPVLLSFDSYEF